MSRPVAVLHRKTLTPSTSRTGRSFYCLDLQVRAPGASANSEGPNLFDGPVLDHDVQELLRDLECAEGETTPRASSQENQLTYPASLPDIVDSWFREPNYDQGLRLKFQARIHFYRQFPAQDAVESEKVALWLNTRPLTFMGARGTEILSILSELIMERVDRIEDIFTDFVGELSQAYNLVAVAIESLRFFVGPAQRPELAGRQWSPPPPMLAAKRCAVVVQNKDPRDRRCFAYAVMAAVLREQGQRSLERPWHYCEAAQRGRPSKARERPLPPLRPCANLDFSMFDWEAGVDEAALWAFERANRWAIFCYCWHRGAARLCRSTRLAPGAFDREVVLVLYERNGLRHYCLCTNFGRLMASKRAEGERAQRNAHRFWCHRCSGWFWTAARLKRHLEREWCVERSSARFTPGPRLPPAPSGNQSLCLDFDRYEQLHLHPAVLYYDFETRQDPQTGRHSAVSFAWVLAARGWAPRRERNLKVAGEGESAEALFVKDIADVLEDYRSQTNWPLQLSADQDRQHRSQTHCYACRKPFSWERVSCRDHDHLAEQANYRGAACRACNSRMKRPASLLLVAHNAGRFDITYLLRGIQAWKAEAACPEWVRRAEVQPLQRSENHFICLRFGGLLAIDSFRFLSHGLGKLIETQRSFDDGDLRRSFPRAVRLHPCASVDAEKLSALLRKLPFPYRLLAEPTERWTDLPALPAAESFQNDLDSAAEPDLQQLRCVVEKLGLQTFRDLHDCYLWTDVLALADIVERFRDSWFGLQGLDPLQAITGPAASWAACLRSVGPVFELPTEAHEGPAFVELVNRSIMGGVSWVGCPWLRASEGRSIAYFDFRSLYPSVMVSALPVGRYRRVEAEDLLQEALRLIETYQENQDVGYLIEADFEVPPEFHDEIDFPPVAHLLIDDELLSETQRQRRQERGVTSPPRRLVPYLGLHQASGRRVALLKFYLERLHVRLLQVHSIWSFRQAPALKDFVTQLFEKRRVATDRCESETIKLQLNSIYGMTLQNTDKHCRSTISCDLRHFWRKASRPGYDWKVLETEPFLGMLLAPAAEALHCTPRAVGWAVLELSKLSYYQMWYQFKDFWGPSARLVYCECDSVLCSLPTENLQADLLRWNSEGRRPAFDCSTTGIPDCPHRGELGSLKYELPWPDQIEEVVCLASKTYAYRTRAEVTMKNKGLPSRVLAERCTFDLFKEALLEPRSRRETFHSIRTENLAHFTLPTTRQVFGMSDEKSFLCGTDPNSPAPFLTRPLGHHRNHT